MIFSHLVADALVVQAVLARFGTPKLRDVTFAVQCSGLPL